MTSESYEPTVEEILEYRRTDVHSLFMRDDDIVRYLKRIHAPPPPPEPEWPAGFELPTRSKRGSLWPKSADNNKPIATPNQDYLLPEVDLTPPNKAVEELQKMFDGLNVANWEQALKVGVLPAIKACKALSLDPARLIVSPWVKRSALQKIGNIETRYQSQSSGIGQAQHYGALIEQVVFPRLKRVYKDRGLKFTNYLAREMASDNYLMMTDETAAWLTAREEEVEGDVCFSAVILDLFHGFSVDATRFELKSVKRMIGGTSFVIQQILLTQSQLQTKWEELHWWMAGDKYDSNGASSFPSAPYCGVYGDVFGFGSDDTDGAFSHYGSVVFLADSLSD